MYNGVKVFDIHGHVLGPSASRGWVVGLLSTNSPLPSPISGVARFDGPGGMRMPDELSEEAFADAAKAHADYLDARNIDVQLIGPRPITMLGWMEPHLLPSWATFTNDAIYQICRSMPDRFLGAAMLPQIATAPDLSNCVPELERCVQEYGFAACYLSPDPAGRRNSPPMSDPYWFPVYAKCQELGIPIIVHGTNCLDPRMQNLPLNYQIGFMFEQFLAMHILWHSDVFERFPELKVVICHCGGALNRFLPNDHLHLPQKDVSNNLFVDTCAYDDDFLTAAIKQRGVSQCCFGTEAPGAGWAKRPNGRPSDDLVAVIGDLDFLSEEDKVAIFNRNPAHLVPAFEK